MDSATQHRRISEKIKVHLIRKRSGEHSGSCFVITVFELIIAIIYYETHFFPSIF